MRVVIKKTVERDFMGGRTIVTKIVIDEPNARDLVRLLGGQAQGAGKSLGAPSNTGPIDVSNAMHDAARSVFLSPERVEALRETLAEVYRAMEQAWRSRR